MNNNDIQNKKFDLSKLQKNYFEASVQNVIQANEAIKSAQNWLLILGLAELSFLGAIILKSESPSLYIKIILTALLSAFVLFILGSVKQYKHLLSSARYYDALSNKTLDKVERGQQYTDVIPEDIKLNKQQIKSDRVTNLFLFSAFCLIVLSTIALLPLILYM
jgi:hypothetical protein